MTPQHCYEYITYMTTNHIQTFNSKFLSVVNSYNYYLYFLIIPGFEDNFNKQEGEYISTQGEKPMILVQ